MLERGFKMKKFKLTAVIVTTAIIFTNVMTVLAATPNKVIPDDVPERMQPFTIIQYQSDGHYVIKQGGLPTSDMHLNENGLTSEEQRLADARYAWALTTVSSPDQIVKEEPTVATVGLVVYYDCDGFIKETFGPTTRKSFLKRGTTSPVGTYTWGTSNNTLVVTSNTVTGKGRLTTFESTEDETGKTLHKGDVATAGYYDNPKHGIEVTVTAKPKNGIYEHSETMTKKDIGTLGNAILDIYKTGVEYWGYTYVKDQTSISNGSYTYTR